MPPVSMQVERSQLMSDSFHQAQIRAHLTVVPEDSDGSLT